MNKKSLILSAALAGILSAGSSALADEHKADKAEGKKEAAMTGECHGANGCKGHGECAGAGTSCKGTNACKGKGWNSMTEKDCKAKKGKWQAKKM